MDITTTRSGLDEIIDFTAISEEYDDSSKVEEILEHINSEAVELALIEMQKN